MNNLFYLEKELYYETFKSPDTPKPPNTSNTSNTPKPPNTSKPKSKTIDKSQPLNKSKTFDDPYKDVRFWKIIDMLRNNFLFK